MKNIFRKIKIKLGLYDLKAEGIKWVAENLGEEYVDEFCDKYDSLSRGVPIGGLFETVAFIHMIEKIKEDIGAK